MKLHFSRATRLSDLIATAFDEARCYTKDPRLVSRVVTRAVTDLMRGVRWSLRTSTLLRRRSRRGKGKARVRGRSRSDGASVKLARRQQASQSDELALSNWEGEGGRPS